MISRTEAEKIIFDAVDPTSEVEEKPLTEVLGSSLAGDAISDIDIPPFNRVTMDGYAVVSSDGPGEYEVVEYVPAGVCPKIRLASGKVSRIMTGAPLAGGSGRCGRSRKNRRFYKEVGEKATIQEGVRAGANVAKKGEDLKTGGVALKAGSTIGPAEISILATAGCDPVPVIKSPTVGILATGDELVAPSEKPGPGQIRNSNAWSIYAHAMTTGALPEILGAASDETLRLDDKIALGGNYDFFLVSGGVSAGDKDFVPSALKNAGYEILFHKVKIKPGKPVLFGKSKEGRYVFGLPGNPVSTLVAFELFVKPAIKRFSGVADGGAVRIKAELSGTFKRKPGQREEYIPVKLSWINGRYVAEQIDYHGSGHMGAFTQSNGLFMIPVGETALADQFIGDAIFMR